MRKLMLALLTVVVMGLAMPMAAELCTIDPVPAATLLLPYFEVDLSNADGVTTLFSVNNASASATLAHVTVWSDLSVPVLDFDIYLTGYDVQTVNMRDILVDGRIPQTASAGQDPGDVISPKGIFSQDINFASCTGPLPPPATIGSVYITHLQNALTGLGSTLETGAARCYGLAYGDNHARGYVTIDTVNACSLFYPSDAVNYWNGIAGNRNILWGDMFFVDSANNFAQGDTLVHIEATGASFVGEVYPAFTPFAVIGDPHTFYGRYFATLTNADQRESLPSVYAVRYLDGGVFDGGTDLTVWRDSNSGLATHFACPAQLARPAWYPLGTTQIVVFDEEENPVIQEDCPVSPCGAQQVVTIPAETQRVEIGVDIPVDEDFGWLYLNLNHVLVGGRYPDGRAQAWVGANMDAQGRFSVGFQAVSLNQLCNIVGDPNISIGN